MMATAMLGVVMAVRGTPLPHPPVSTFIRDTAAGPCPADFDLHTDHLGRRGDYESSDITPDVEHHHPLTGMGVLGVSHRDYFRFPPGVPGLVVKPLLGCDRYGKELRNASPYGALSLFAPSVEPSFSTFAASSTL